jgi:predicted transcriptional regulator
MAIDLEPEQRESVTEHIEKGFAQAERGELIDGDAAIAMLRQRRAERANLLGPQINADGHG